MNKILIIIAPQGYQDHEYEVPKKIWENAGYTTTTASTVTGTCHGKLGGTTQSELLLTDAKVDAYDAVVFVGGPGAYAYQQNTQAHRLARETISLGKILAAICIAPTILAYAGVLKGKRATVWNDDGEQAKLFIEQGVQLVNDDVVTDGKIITANGPAAAAKFARTIFVQLNK